MTGWSLEDQCDPEALAAWNVFAEDPQGGLSAILGHLREDFPSFCALLLKIKPKGGGYVMPFLFNQVQRRIWREICRLIEERRPLWFVMLKFRQAGMSTFWDAWLFWQMWRQSDVQCMVIAHQLKTAETMIETMKVFYDELPDVFKPELREGNHGASIPRGEVYFADRRSWGLIHLAKNIDPRGGQPTHVLETEYSSFPDPAALNAALLPSLPTFGSEERLRSSFIIESTPKGQNAFYDVYWNAKKGVSHTFHAMFFPWFLFDDQYSAKAPPNFRLSAEEKREQTRLSRLRMEYPVEDGGGVPVTLDQMFWRRETILTDFDGDEEQFNQEMPSDDVTCWLLGSKSVFRQFGDALMDNVADAKERAKDVWAEHMHKGKPVVTKGPARLSLLTDIDQNETFTPIREVKFEFDTQGSWLVWEPPNPGHKYSIGGSPTLGLLGGGDSIICVIDVTAGRQVAEFCESMGIERFAIEMAAAGYWYNQALLVPEIKSIGFILLKRLIANIMYPNLFRWPKWDEVNRYTHKRGWETNDRTMQISVSTMTSALENGLVEIASEDLLGEMSTFEASESDGIWSFEAQKGREDARVLAFGLAMAGVEQTPVLSRELGKAKRMPSAMDLHLASGMADMPVSRIPKQIADLLANNKQVASWNPFSEGFVS